MSKVRDIRERRARRRRIAHELDDRLIPDLDGAPQAVRDEQAKVEKLVKRRGELSVKVREAGQVAQRAPAQDRAAKRAALAEGKPFPKPTEATARATADELRNQYRAAKDAEATAFERFAEVIADHAPEWMPHRSEAIEAKAEVVVETTTAALDAWRDLDAEFSFTAWLHRLDPANANSHRLTNAPALRIGDQEGERVLEALIGLARRATATARSSTPGREQWAQARAERQAKREQRAQRRQKVVA